MAIVAALLISVVLLGAAAIGVDVARWLVVAERTQTAADAAALAGVIYLPDNLPQAREAAIDSAELNGFTHHGNATVTVEIADRRSQLRVTITSSVTNQFGAAIGVDTASVSRTAVADYTSPAPMGSPCNTFGNEPPGGSLTTGPATSTIPDSYRSICSNRPHFWAAIEGPQTTKQQGDRYSTLSCSSTYGCNSSSQNTEAVYPEGYFFAIKIGEAAKNTAITLQLYDPAYYATGATCGTMPESPPRNSINPFSTTDALARYATGTNVYCSGDINHTGSRSTTNPVTTSFAIREQNDQQDPLSGNPIAGCTKQFRGSHTPPSMDSLRYYSGRSTNYTGTPQTSYDPDKAHTFHQWYPLCTFTPTRTGDYYLQVRSNVPLGGTPMSTNNGRTPIVYRDNAAVTSDLQPSQIGLGANSFGIRAVGTPAASESISVSGWSRMPMLQNTPDSVASFNLLRVLPAAAGQSIAFEFFDVADGSTARGAATVLPPRDATGSVVTGPTGCTGALNDEEFAGIDDCSADIENATHDGQVQRMRIPIPADYDCDETVLTGCWFRVEVSQNGNITDFTTWDASLEGDPVRLIE